MQPFVTTVGGIVGGVCIFMLKMVLRYGDEKTRIN